ncbi:DUF1707 domain-containing protein [uncultured Nocardioides sp.]|uniref:DUF1707 SHOCT-like domain-containing protein n=1 Tax=uncultured Nocardioides sp. TaxID=198441 RepID=UPI0026067D4A|nr:DUF1707 domain-containing protein [uncultured Nocardioides sp.]
MSLQGPTGGDPARLRISDAERHRTADVLRDAAAEGRLDITELEERIEATYAAKTYADLVPIVADLPAGRDVPGPTVAQGGPAGPLVPAQRYDTSIAVMSGQDRRGVWEVGPSHQAFALMGGVTLDLREARFAAQEVVITAVTFWGGVDVVVGARHRVSVEGIGIMGGFAESRPKVEAAIAPDSPLVRVRGVAIMGGVNVVRKPDPGQKKLRRRG